MSKILAATVALLLVFPWVRGAESSTDQRYAASPAAWEGKVMTVTGLLPAEAMGITLPHEHLLIVHTIDSSNLKDEHLAGDELKLYLKAGGRTLVEMTSLGIGRRPDALKRIAERTGAQLIMGCGYYKDKWLSYPMRAQHEDEIAGAMIHDIVQGVDGVHAGVIGELGVSREITPFEQRQLRAAAVAQQVTGAAINLHFDMEAPLTERARGLDILEKAGGDLSRVVVSHFRPQPAAIDLWVAVAKRGCYVEFDMFGLEKHIGYLSQDTDFAKAIKALIDRGYLDHILISQDLCFAECYTKNGGYGYAHLLKDIVPKLKAAGIADEQVRAIMVENPKRLFPFHLYSK